MTVKAKAAENLANKVKKVPAKTGNPMAARGRIDKTIFEEHSITEVMDWFAKKFPNGTTVKLFMKNVAGEDFYYTSWFSLFEMLTENGLGFDLNNSGNLFKRCDLVVPGSLTVSGDLKVTGNLIVGNELDVSGNVEIYGSLICSNNISVAGNIDVKGDINCGTYIDCNGYIKAWLDIASGLNEELLNELGLGFGYISVKESIETAESISVNLGNLIADQFISCGNDLKVTMGSIQAGGNIGVDGDIDCDNYISAGGSICGDYIRAVDYIVATENLTSHSSIIVTRNHIEACNIVAGSEIKCGPIKCHNLVAGSIEANGDVVVTNDIITNTDISATQSIVVGKRIYAGGTIKTGDEFNIITGYKIKKSEWEKFPCVRSASLPTNILAGEWKMISRKQVLRVGDDFKMLEERSAE